MFAEPLWGYRRARTRKRRTKIDWAFEVAEQLDTRYAVHEQVIIIMDNLNTHKKGRSTKHSSRNGHERKFSESTSVTPRNMAVGWMSPIANWAGWQIRIWGTALSANWPNWRVKSRLGQTRRTPNNKALNCSSKRELASETESSLPK